MGKNRHYNNQNNYKQEQRPEIMAAPIEEEVVEEVVETKTSDETASLAKGVVVDCSKLRVRKEASDTADVLDLLEVSTEVQVDLESSTADFFKVFTESGIEGYCMKKFIAVV